MWHAISSNPWQRNVCVMTVYEGTVPLVTAKCKSWYLCGRGKIKGRGSMAGARPICTINVE